MINGSIALSVNPKSNAMKMYYFEMSKQNNHSLSETWVCSLCVSHGWIGGRITDSFLIYWKKWLQNMIKLDFI